MRIKFRKATIVSALVITMVLNALASKAATVAETYNFIYDDDTNTAALMGVVSGIVLKGDVQIPGSVTCDGKRYTVTSIGMYNDYTWYSALASSAAMITGMPEHTKFWHDVRFDTNVIDPAFLNQTEITSIFIPSSIEKIDVGTFIGCSKLKEFKVSSSNEGYVAVDGVLMRRFSGDNTYYLVCYPPAKVGVTYAIPDNVLEPSPFCFAGADNLTTLNLGKHFMPNTERSIGWLLGNSTISKFVRHSASTWDVSVSSNGDMLIEGNQFLLAVVPGKTFSTLNLPSGVTVLNYGSLAGSHIGTIDLTNVAAIRKAAFVGSTIKRVSIPSSVTAIGEYAFTNCRMLTTVEFNAGISDDYPYIPYACFAGCTALTDFTSASNINNIHSYAFVKCSSLKSFSMTGIKFFGSKWMNPTTTGFYHFAYSGLENANIPTGISDLGYGMFKGCKNLTSISLKKTTHRIPANCFAESGLETFNTTNLKEIDYDAFFNCQSLRKFVISDSGQLLTLAPEVIPAGNGISIYIDHKNFRCYDPWNYQYRSFAYGFKIDGSDYTVYTSRLTPNEFIDQWTNLYCPARVKNHYQSFWPFGEVSEMFSYNPTLDKGEVEVVPNFWWVKITGVSVNGKNCSNIPNSNRWTTSNCSEAEVEVSYTANGVKMSTTYTNKYNNSTGIEEIQGDNENTIKTIYNVSGQKINELHPGINIIIYSDGESKKVII